MNHKRLLVIGTVAAITLTSLTGGELLLRATPNTPTGTYLAPLQPQTAVPSLTPVRPGGQIPSLTPRTPARPAATGASVGTAKPAQPGSSSVNQSPCRAVNPTAVPPTPTRGTPRVATASATVATPGATATTTWTLVSNAVEALAGMESTEPAATEQAAGNAMGGATAQPTPEGVIFGSRIEVLFPAAVRSDVGVHVPALRLKTVRLRLFEPGTSFDVTEDADLTHELTQFTDTDSLIIHAWHIDPSKAPPIFSTASYQWTVETTDSVRDSLTGSFIFTDSRPDQEFNWCTFTVPPLTIYTVNKNLAVSWASLQFQAVQARLITDTGIRHDNVRVMVYEPGVGFCTADPANPGGYIIRSHAVDFSTACDPTQGEVLYRAEGYEFVVRAEGAFEFRDQLVRSMAADTYNAYWGTAAIPPWFRSGMAQIYEILPRVDALTVATQALSAGNLLPLAGLNAPPPVDRKLWDAESFMLVKYLESRYGPKGLIAMAHSLTETPFDDAIRNLTGTTIDDVYVAWRNWLITDDAASAVNLTFYTGDTPTPTDTDTPAPTPTPVTPTPTDTLFPTLRPASPTPSITPLPAGRFATWTPVPPKPAPQTGICPGSTAWLAVPGLVVLFKRRRRPMP
ncbi:MAG TPA: hypothetical protein VMT34_13275 [Aggregatilineales bacterium]|nr:hypothetical protein [Aggregatilineales bacterium]